MSSSSRDATNRAKLSLHAAHFTLDLENGRFFVQQRSRSVSVSVFKYVACVLTCPQIGHRPAQRSSHTFQHEDRRRWRGLLRVRNRARCSGRLDHQSYPSAHQRYRSTSRRVGSLRCTRRRTYHSTRRLTVLPTNSRMLFPYFFPLLDFFLPRYTSLMSLNSSTSTLHRTVPKHPNNRMTRRFLNLHH